MGNSDLDEEIDNATISFVPQVGNGGKKKRNKREGDYTDPGASGNNNNNNHSAAPPAGYGAPPQGNYPPQPNQYEMQPPMMNGNYNYGQQPPMGGFQSFPPPPNPYQNDPHFAQGPPSKMQNAYPAYQQQPTMGQPVNFGSPTSDYQAYPQAAAYAPGQPGAMLLLVEESHDLDYQAPLFSFESCVGCLNHWFCIYCQLARQQNMIRALNNDPSAIRRSPNGVKSQVNEQRAHEISQKLPSYNGCCAAALTFDVASLALSFFFPQFFGIGCINGFCIQAIQTRQQVRARFGIIPHQCQDCLVSLFCTPCGSAQQQQELMMRGANPNLFIGDEQPNMALRGRRMN